MEYKIPVINWKVEEKSIRLKSGGYDRTLQIKFYNSMTLRNLVHHQSQCVASLFVTTLTSSDLT